ncbi:MAG: hypothetical protein JST79_02905 [Acidobacteria bacterium]|jgi:hypothetical protein|nr:hypothetical protein [Acidobacteriota bacterium]
MKTLLLSLALAMGMATLPGQLLAQQTDPPQTPGEMPAQTQDINAFTGTIAKEHGKLVLKDATSGTSYQIDDQAKAKQYVGKAVRVTGKLDSSTNVLHVQSIEAAGS